MIPDVVDNTALSRTARFARFLREAVAIKTKRVLEVQKYPQVVWFGDLPREPAEIRSPLIAETWPDSDGAWLKVARVQEPDRPVPPAVCVPWLRDVDLDTPGAAPALNASYEDRDAKGERIDVPVTADASLAWEQYVSVQWTPWAAKADIARRVKPIYQKLFSIREQFKDAADSLDLFVGIGLYDSKVQPDERFRRHLLAFPAELSIDSRSGLITLGPSADFTSARVETDFVPTTERTRLQPQVDALQSDIEALGAGLRDQAAIGDVLTRLITPVSAHVRYVRDLAPVDARAREAVVSFGAALILRPRSTRSLDALLEKIQKDASREEPRFPESSLPVPWRKMLEDGEAWDTASRERELASGGRAGSDTQVFFPLPSNDEQMRIVQKADGTPGVVVQGPPGTGKSHTIANLISHYLAEGRRVLVTAQTAQALQVLRDKMPEELQQLCVTLLGDSRASDRDLKRSVSGILHRQQDFSAAAYERRIKQLDASLVATRTRINELERTLHQARAAETQPLEPETGYRGTRAAIARQLRDERPKYQWLRDPIPHRTPCPSPRHGWEGLAVYHQSLDADTRARLALEVIAVPFSNDEARQSIEAIQAARRVLAATPPVGASAPPLDATASQLAAAQQWLTRLAAVELGATQDDDGWTSALRKVLLRNPSVWAALKDESRAALQPLDDDAVAATARVTVDEHTPAEARAALARLEEHYAHGGGRRGFFGRPAVVKENDWVEQAVNVEGAAIQTPEEITRAKLALDGWALLDAAWAPWAEWKSKKPKTARAQVTALTARTELLEKLLQCGADAGTLSPTVRQWLVSAFDNAVPTNDLRTAVARRLHELALADAVAQRDSLVSALRQAIGPLAVVPALQKIATAMVSEDSQALANAQGELEREIRVRQEYSGYLEFISAVRQFAPLLAADIVAAEGTADFAERFKVFSGAWRHRTVQDWLDTMLSKERIEAMHRAARDERQGEQELLSELTATKAWAAALQRINDLQRATLTTWAQAVAAIPATGKNVFAKRAAAQRLLGGCLSSIPAWVVSLSRLYETVNPVPGLFDVAIVDEASQCWLDSLVLFYLAKQVIIVGDDKQISPTVVGVADSEVEALANTYLPDFQFRSSFTLTSSLFDHGRRYLSAGVPLREHFRCVPEIIAFSNRLCYTERPLIPLRQVASDRLEPLKRTYLQNGLRSRDINDVEAHAIVDAIAACHEDPAYDDCDFGVICLQGDDQGERIEQLLVERLGAQIYEQRNIRCGNPYVFQGDERDVIFMSMIVAPNQTHQSLTTAMYEQRFNVAMSRARDQVWLFHSVQEDELGANCLRGECSSTSRTHRTRVSADR
jgi:hypothetical protein